MNREIEERNRKIGYDNLPFTSKFVKLLNKYNESADGSEKGEAIRNMLDFISYQQQQERERIIEYLEDYYKDTPIKDIPDHTAFYEAINKGR